MKRSVYIETTIPSFYHEVRSEPEMIARRESTRRWWKEDRSAYELYSSAFVQAVNGELGLAAPIITTPDLLLMETNICSIGPASRFRRIRVTRAIRGSISLDRMGSSRLVLNSLKSFFHAFNADNGLL